uniref:Glucose-6-phosphate isomerase n=1 Tax=Candidatus Kentrum sp. FM TaxID=2126340 RepID=A0A450SQE7_9GAMM|nr:MAG: glucose-6-phosphate isomerase [Candidatus Kentron sp. FM]VFJ56230.1 MAG: glucose-6-phosphate isomerase [Candidatus Kentron sp. FM]VFK10145.1 MAG: glucose-6-phosphate isomerase [Candidatus Kentron sp. FM]
MTTTKLATKRAAWAKLDAHYEKIKETHMRDLFLQDPKRFDHFHAEACGLMMDYSKHRIGSETIALLTALAKEADLAGWIGRMMAGEKINNTEGRAALHAALRYRAPGSFPAGDADVMHGVRDVLGRVRLFTEEIQSGSWRGATGKPIETIINIGIGGSDLGPVMASRALGAYQHERLTGYFVSNLDATQLVEALDGVDPETVLFIIASKTFTTQETLTNAKSAREWFVGQLGESAVAKHFVAVSTALEHTSAFGISPANVFEFWDWVGGRYSLWSAIGLPIATLIGMDNFEELLAGGHDMDEHFKSAPYDKNLPVLMGLLDLWYRNFFGAQSHVVLPYDYALRSFPDYLQQLEMESNGKRVTRDGEPVDYPTGSIIWGGPGNNGQHAFYQLMHQGKTLIPSDFIVPMRCQYSMGDHDEAMLSNALAQTEALMKGRNEKEAKQALVDSGMTGEELNIAVPHRILPGNQPSTTLVYERLTPRILGSLIALYEHKVFTGSVIWGIDAFDQWGVELGKQMAKVIMPELTASEEATTHDSSTNALINYIRKGRAAS